MQAQRFEVGPDATAVPAARRAAVAALRDRVSGDVLDAVELVVSELVGNALLHAAPPLGLVVGPASAPETARVEVHDGSRTLPVRTRSAAGAQGLTGRGLALIDAIAASWGVEATAQGKVVWVELTPASVAAAQPGDDADLDDLLDGFEDWPQLDVASFAVTLPDVPTDLLLAAKEHVDSVVRELALTATGAASGVSAALPAHLHDLAGELSQSWVDVRHAVKRQAVAAAERGEQRTTLHLSLPLSAADEGERYLAAIEQTDSYGRASRLLTLAASPQHRAFHRWYVTSLVDALRRAARGEQGVVPRSFESHLLREIDHLATLQQVSERSARLQRVSAALSAALSPRAVAETVLSEAVADLGALRGMLLVPVPGDPALRAAASTGCSPELLAATEAAWRTDAVTPCTQAWVTGTAVWAESADDLVEHPDLKALERDTGAACAIPLQAGGERVGLLSLSFLDSRLFDDDERAFLRALAAVAASALERASLHQSQAEVADRLTRLQGVTAALTAAQGLDEVLDVTVEHATGLVGAWRAALGLLRDDGCTVDLVRMVPSLGPDHDGWASFDVEQPVPMSEAVRTGEVVFAATVAERDARWPAIARYARDLEHSLVVLPLRAEGAAIGGVSLSFPTTGRPPDLALLSAFADACAQSVERARAADRARRASERLAFLAEASADLAQSLDVERTLAGIARLAVPAIGDWCVVHLVQDGELRALAVEHVDPAKTELAWSVQRRWPSRRSDPQGVAQVVRTGEPQLIPDIPALVATMEAAGLPLPQRDPEHEALLQGLGLHSALIVPLRTRGRTLGALTFITAESGRTYGDDDLAFCLDLARRAAVALDNARLFGAATERAARELPEAVAAPDRTAQLLETMADAFFRLDRDWRFTYVNGQAETLLFRGREELLGRDLWAEFPDAMGSEFEVRYREALDTGRQATFEAWFAPLDSWFEVRASPDPDGLSVFFHDVTLRKLAEQAQESSAERLALLAEATRLLVGAVDPEEVLRRVTGVLVPRLAAWAVAALTDDDGRLQRMSAVHADPVLTARLQQLVDAWPDALLSVPRVARVLATGMPELVPGPRPPAPPGVDDALARLVEELDYGSALVVPLAVGERVLGVVVVLGAVDAPSFTEDDLVTAVDLGRRAGLAVENAQLFERQRTAVEVLQRSMLTALPSPDGLALTARYRAAGSEAQVGGDWYDAFQQPDGATVLVIGDVIGHDTVSAAAMGQLRSLLRGTAYDRQEDPARVLRRVDTALRGLRIDTLATALVARLEQSPEQRGAGVHTLRWSSAGHPPAVLRRAAGRVTVLDAPADLLLGFDADATRHDHVVELATGDTLLLYTDGLVERRDSDLADGIRLLCRTLDAVGALPLEEVCDALLVRLLPEQASDDVALVALRVESA